jgi:hypothetical protein
MRKVILHESVFHLRIGGARAVFSLSSRLRAILSFHQVCDSRARQRGERQAVRREQRVGSGTAENP